MAHKHEEPVLRAKYRDYCSARVADAILALTPEEIYTLAEAGARSAGEAAPSTYDQAIRLATGTIRDRLELPDFEDWAPQYAANPERFDPYLMGFWQEEKEPAPGK